LSPPNLSGQARETHSDCQLAKVTLAVSYAEIASARDNVPDAEICGLQLDPETGLWKVAMSLGQVKSENGLLTTVTIGHLP
jgi:hypothetical protein